MHQDPAALAMLALEVGPMLADLAAWEPVGTLAETMRGAAYGHDSLSVKDIRRLRIWNARWNKIHTQCRRFYAQHAHEHESTSVALFHILERQPQNLKQNTKAGVLSLWREHMGTDPMFSLFPRVP